MTGQSKPTALLLLLKPFNKVRRSADIDGPVFDQCLLYQVPYLLVKILIHQFLEKLISVKSVMKTGQRT